MPFGSLNTKDTWIVIRVMQRWFDRNILELGREMRLAYLPPLMVYAAAGISGLTGIVGTFFVKEHLGLSAAFLAGLGFWAGIPWALKMPIGHLVDLIWRRKALLVYLGASLIAVSLIIMVALIGDRATMTHVLPAEVWFVLSTLLAPVGYVIQDAVADAMTVEAVPRFEPDGAPVSAERRRLMHTTMQTLGRVAIIGGTVLVALINLYLFTGVDGLPPAQIALIYRNVYAMALAIPAISVAGVLIASYRLRSERRRLLQLGKSAKEVEGMLFEPLAAPSPNGWIIGGSLLFVVFILSMGLSELAYSQEIVFIGSLAIVGFLIGRLTRQLDPTARTTLLGTAIVIFAFRAVPSAGPGVTWWLIDELKFDQQFLSVLSLIGSALTLLGMFVFRRFMAERSISYIVGFLTLAGTILAAPIVGLYFGLHEWTAAMTGGLIDARFIALVDTALESPLGQIAMIPMLAWIANSAPRELKATYFAVMASFTNLALSASQLGTKYLNQWYVVKREVVAAGAQQTAADYSQLGDLLLTQTAIGFALPFVAIALIKLARLRSS